MTLAGKHILITSGPTHADIDAVRFISNRSSGRLGCAIALAALDADARVTMVAGPDSVVPDAATERLHVLHVETVDDVISVLDAELQRSAPDAVLHAMAVLDYVPAEPEVEKTPSGRDEWYVRLVKTPKVIRLIRDWAPKTCLVQFKLEVGLSDEALLGAAVASMRGNRADLCVANDLSRIRDEIHPALIIARDGAVLARPGTKSEIARELCRILADVLASSTYPPHQ